MKVLKIIYIVSCILLTVFSIALLGASGHQIAYFRNPQNIFLMSFSIVMALIAIISIISFFNSKVINSKLFFALLLMGIIFKIIAFIKFLTVKSSVDVEPLVFLVWLGTLIILSGVFIAKQWKSA